MSPMATMARAIRLVLEPYGKTLKDIPTKDLKEFTEIITAFSMDLRDELDSR